MIAAAPGLDEGVASQPQSTPAPPPRRAGALDIYVEHRAQCNNRFCKHNQPHNLDRDDKLDRPPGRCRGRRFTVFICRHHANIPTCVWPPLNNLHKTRQPLYTYLGK